MSNSLCCFSLIVYTILFYWKVIKNPILLAYGEALDYDFPIMINRGRYWRKGQIPKDEYHFTDPSGSTIGTFYPLNILCSWLSRPEDIDKAWVIHSANIFIHLFSLPIVAYFMFGQGVIGLFGGLAWGFYAYHMKNTLWYVQTFAWFTITMFMLNSGFIIGAGVSLGMLFLCGFPPFILYSMYVFTGYCIFYNKFYWVSLVIGLCIGGYQILEYWKYSKKCVQKSYTLADKIENGRVPAWVYLMMVVPVRVRDFISGVGFEEMAFYVTPVVGLFALTKVQSLDYWVYVAIGSFLLSRGGIVFRLFHKLMRRFPQRWGYFVGISFIFLAVEGVSTLTLSQLWVMTLLTAVLIWFNRGWLDTFPFAQWTTKVSKHFNTPMLSFLRGYKVNNLPYPVYRGLINEIVTVGYTGGGHTVSLGRLLNVPKQGVGNYNWFNYNKDGDEVDSLKIKYHIGKTRPSNDPKWVKVEGINEVWENTNCKS